MTGEAVAEERGRRFHLGRLRDPALFALALLPRLAYLFLVDEPLLKHQQVYFVGGLTIALHPEPWRFVLRSDDWHLWAQYWTLAPLYNLFLGGGLALFGHVQPIQVVQCVLDAAAAVLVGFIGRRVVSRGGTWAGVAYAVYWPAVEIASRFLTENLHTPLLIASFAVLLAGPRPTERRDFAGGFLLGLSALARAVSAAFLPLAAWWRWRAGGRDRWLGTALLTAGAAAAILPWTARNALVLGEPVLIETVGIYNLWDDNTLVDRTRHDRQEYFIHKEPTPEARRAKAMSYVWRGLRERPGRFAVKVWDNARHLLRPEGLHQLLRAELPRPPWWHLSSVLFQDIPFALAVVLFTVFALAGPASPARSLLLLWTAYYLFMIVVAFHNEIRYRTVLVPFLFAGAVGGVAILSDRRARTAGRARLALLLGLALALLPVSRYLGQATDALRSRWTLRHARTALARGDLAAADAAALRATGQDDAARPWIGYGRALAQASRPAEAIEAFRHASERRPDHWVPLLWLPRLLEGAGRPAEAAEVAARAETVFAGFDAWHVLETAWRELPAPRTDEVRLARGDYGAVRNFLRPDEDHRWTRDRAWLRIVPTVAAPAYEVTLEMGSPEPSPLVSPEVTVRGPGAETRFTLGREVRPYVLRVAAPAPGRPLIIELTSPTWNALRNPPEQGIRVDRMTVTALAK